MVNTRCCLLLVCVLAGSLLATRPLPADVKLEDVPTFQVRSRIVSVGGNEPAGQQFSLRYDVGGPTVTVEGGAWSKWLPFGQEQIEATLKGYPAIYLKGWPVVVRLVVGGVIDPTVVEAELKFDGAEQPVALSGELLGPRLGVLVWRDDTGRPHAATMAEYNRRYWEALQQVNVPETQRPRKFPIVDRFIGGDDDRRAWREGIEQLNRAGFSAIMLPPDAKLREMLLATGQRRTAWAVYNPPGYAFDFDPQVTSESIDDWAKQQSKPYRDAGYAPEDMALFAMSDEPGWYYPQAFETLTSQPEALQRFRKYLQAQGLSPADVGAKTWEDVLPISRSQAKSLPSKRLFYWTMRFFPFESARHFARCTAALEEAFYPGAPVLTNWNFFSGRFYVPGPVANNRDKQSPDAAMGGHDWLEFGRLRGGTMLWTEDWFSDRQAYQWSFYCAKLRCAAEKGQVQFGGYVIPRTAGDRKDGVLQKILCVVGSGGKAIKYFVFGPEYNFPGNCYSEKAHVLPKMAEAHAMIGAAEELLWPGRRPKPQAAILHPRSAQVWDAREIAIPAQIQDATNTQLNRSTVDYMAETFDLYLALQHANVPVDFVEEEDLSPAGLKDYRVLYVTEPNVPIEGQRGLAEWVKGGGTLVTVSGAGTHDRYDEPSSLLAESFGIADPPRDRLLVANTKSLPDVAKGNGTCGEFTAVGVQGRLHEVPEGVKARFADGSPAVVHRQVGRGRVVHFAWLPGLSYWKSSQKTKDGLPVEFSPSIRDWITWPIQLALVDPPVVVSHPLVESPLLVSDAGAAVTLLNWTGEPIENLTVGLHLPFPVQSVESVRRGALDFRQQKGRIELAIPLEAADIILLRKAG